MKILGKLFFRGLAAILPLALTGYLIYYAVTAIETILGSVIQKLFEWSGIGLEYHEGTGFVISILLIIAVGLLMYSFIVRAIYRRITQLMTRIPVVKSVYGMIVDIVRLFGTEDKPFQKVVLVDGMHGEQLLGFLTREDFRDLDGFEDDRVAVYLPMSYQLGGFTVIVERSRIREVPMSAEEALRFSVTAGVARHETT